MNFGKGKLIDNITHLVPGRSDLLGSLERGEFDATLLDTRAGSTLIRPSIATPACGNRRSLPLGANRRVTSALSADPPLLASVNKAFSDLQAKGTIAELARAAGLT